MMRRMSGMLAVALVALGLGACGEKATGPRDDLLGFIAKTEKVPRRFVYTDEDVKARKVTVEGVVQDDFRHKERLSVAGAPAVDSIVSDDTLALLVRNPDELGRLVNPKPPTPDPEDPLTSVDTLALLRTGSWVVDPAGAPPLDAKPVTDELGREKESIGEDPLKDSLDVFIYVRKAIASSPGVVRFNEDSPDYKPSEDPFPKPNEKVKERRYDLLRPSLPLPQFEGAGAGRSNLPGAQHLRKLSVYVDERGYIVRVVEQIDPAERLNDLIDRSAGFLKQAGAGEATIRQIKSLRKLPGEQATAAVIEGINILRDRAGDPPVRLRRMELRLSAFGSDKIAVELPTEFKEGRLDVLRNRGRTAGKQDPAGDGPGGDKPGAPPTAGADGGSPPPTSAP